MSDLRKFRYEFPMMEPHFVEAPEPKSVIAYIRRTYPHNFDEVLPTIVEIPMWPEFWKVLDERGRQVPRPVAQANADAEAKAKAKAKPQA